MRNRNGFISGVRRSALEAAQPRDHSSPPPVSTHLVHSALHILASLGISQRDPFALKALTAFFSASYSFLDFVFSFSFLQIFQGLSFGNTDDYSSLD